MVDCQNSLLRSDTSEGITSDTESVDNDIHKPDKITEKEPPKIPQKPFSRLKKTASIPCDQSLSNANELFHHRLSLKNLDNNSFTEPSDVEGNVADTEATSSEEDAVISGRKGSADSCLDSLYSNRREDLCDSASDLSQDSSTGLDLNHEKLHLYSTSDEPVERKTVEERDLDTQTSNEYHHSFKICLNSGDNRGFGFTLKGGKDQGCPAYIENVIKGSPADETGLKDGDKIIYLNGEQIADYSHASIIFSIKQAVYTGMLDIVISRSENCEITNSETRITESRKGKSFAEKLAIFTAGINTPAMNIEEHKSKFTETKKESLVLRRRSAFENGKTETKNVVSRRSSCIVDTNCENVVEKRHSVDFTLGPNTVNENSLHKKGPPPPVPVKPKIKSKPVCFELNKSAIKTNGTSENISSTNGLQSSAKAPSSNFQKESENLSDSCHNLENKLYRNNSILTPARENAPADVKNKLGNSLVPEELLSSHEMTDRIVDLPSLENNSYVNIDKTVANYSDHDQVGVNTVDNDFASCEANDLDMTENLSNETVFETTDETYLFSNNKENYVPDFSEKLHNDSLLQEAARENLSCEISTDAKPITNDISSKPIGVQSPTEYYIDYTNDVNVDMCSKNDNLNGKDFETNPTLSACHLARDHEDTNDSHAVESQDPQTSEETETNESKANTQTNSSPLCLSLEKIDEDDVISASTTTSSDSPDTETVIETLPSNLSPLPNDESNGEDSSKLLIYQDEPPLENVLFNKMSSNEASDQKEIVESYDLNCVDVNKTFQTNDTVSKQSDYSVSDSDVMDKSYYHDQQDDDYARELDESLDQITSLDIIDRIEQSLMDQLQKEDSYEDISTNLNTQLEGDMENPWLYYSEESELLEDLTPRNMEPPRDPPPPPPPPEVERNENEIMTMSRTNSTKRIKKELWRRRSNFLGLDSPDAIDMDHIPPPPPGLEELLKQEREQTQWLEKRLSLAEPEMEISFLSESTCLDSGNYSNNDFSDYFDGNGESSKEAGIDSETEQWKQNMDEESPFEVSYGLDYESAPETLITVIENVKTGESPQHKAKQNIQNLGAAPKAKIMDSTQWITEKVASINKQTIEPGFRQSSCNPNYWLAQDDRNTQFSESHSDRRYSIPPAYSNTHPDVTVRTWGDRENEYPVHRPRSAIYDRTRSAGNGNNTQTQNFDTNYETDTLESEVHKCSCCGKGLCEGSAMGIEALRLYFHIECFRCCLCNIQLGNGSCGTDVQVKNNQLYCPACFTVD